MWSSSNLIRFKDGMLQKRGGWTHLNSTTFLGTARGMHPFQDLQNNTYLAIGTNQRLSLYNFGTVYDITPYRLTTTPAGGAPFAVTLGQSTVVVTDSGATGALCPAVGDWVFISGASAGAFNLGLYGQGVYQAGTTGGINMNGFFQVNAVINASIGEYSVATSTVANQTGTGGGAPTINYLLSSALDPVIGGYGTGVYGSGSFGATTSQGGVAIVLREWSLDNWGQFLVANPLNGGLYLWTPPNTWPPTSGAAAPAVAISSADTYFPTASRGMFVAMPQRQLICFGTQNSTLSNQDPLLVQFSDVGSYTTFTPTVTNQAGSFRLSSGSRIMGGMQAMQNGLIWTDIELWQFQYIGYPLVYGFNKIGIGCGLIGMKAAAKIGPTVYWMSLDGFFSYDGSTVSPLRCSVWDRVFNNIDRNYAEAVFAAPNSYFNEILWFFPVIGGSGAVSNYVSFNVVDQVWDYGQMNRTCWVDQSVLGAPIGADSTTGLIQQHETSNDADGNALDSWAETGWLDMASGQEFIFLERMLTDFVVSSGSIVLITVKVCNYVGDTPRVYGPFSITSATENIIIRARGRFIAIRVESQGTGSFWRVGQNLMLTSAAGRR